MWWHEDLGDRPWPAEPPPWEDNGWTLLRAIGPSYGETAEIFFHDFGGSGLSWAAEQSDNACAVARGMSAACTGALKELVTTWPDGDPLNRGRIEQG
ncbi:hypothetical protein GCM10022226_61150 [Sphaerisporangium flaviroseum]|uniref:Uncharacterized protein n=1 Tax=Sphaerisporangium flaviroseum TaxID=509199 RepID=A0ABP7J0R9_9ACTN